MKKPPDGGLLKNSLSARAYRMTEAPEFVTITGLSALMTRTVWV
jgi:hypothetical protein